MLTVDKLSYSVGNKTILADINFDLQHNSLTCILGPNGAGKTSLLKQICGLSKNKSATIKFGDEDLLAMTELQRAALIAYVPQKTSSLPDFSVREFIQQASYCHSAKTLPIDLDAILLTCELKTIEKQSLSTLSGGEMQRVLFASSLYQASPLILLDEVTAGLDPAHHDSICQLIHKTKELHKLTYLWVTHDINAALRYADRILILKNSKLIFDDTPDALKNGILLSEIFEKEFKVLSDEQGQKYLI
ncbi:ABC transporter ATP-binding protein [Lentisphaera profundi]|uniref:ABC transporter ATP-binding protein n=1 Tax=Lentisphaera profundi TaxID=1658616 RepID=A0ABY7VSN6_9BACT|nr:ABC transporter ATP-binding protein [Lentisphaera profundi]WDE97220.1 ABC transporter ATP-binding protein [Lentisphaera profundi]